MEQCTHPKLVSFFDVMDNCYVFACEECLESLRISAYGIVRYTRQEWRKHILGLVTQTFGETWGQKAREWLEQTEDKIRE